MLGTVEDATKLALKKLACRYLELVDGSPSSTSTSQGCRAAGTLAGSPGPVDPTGCRPPSPGCSGEAARFNTWRARRHRGRACEGQSRARVRPVNHRC